MLMRYQAALRSDGAALPRSPIITALPQACNAASRDVARIITGVLNWVFNFAGTPPIPRRTQATLCDLHLGRRTACHLCLALAWRAQALFYLILQGMRRSKDENPTGADRHFLAGFGISTDALALLSDREAAKR